MSQALIDLVREKLPDAVVSSHSTRGDEVVVVKREHLVEVVTFLRNDPAANMKLLSQIVAIDLLTYKSEMTGGGSISSIEAPAYDLQKKQPVEPRYYVAYNLYSVTSKKRLRLHVQLRSDDVKALNSPAIPISSASCCIPSLSAIRCARTIRSASASRWSPSWTFPTWCAAPALAPAAPAFR
jgi:NADH:ubiquinone oxidoreductase subunit C